MLAAIELAGLRIDRYHIILLFSVAGLLFGLFVAEYYFHKSARHTNHVMPATIIVNSKNIAHQKIIYYGMFVSLVACRYLLSIDIPEACYTLVVFAIVGGDIQKIANKMFRLK